MLEVASITKLFLHDRHQQCLDAPDFNSRDHRLERRTRRRVAQKVSH